MIIKRYRLPLTLLAVALAAACGREGPTAVGGALLPGGSIRTFELILDAPAFLASDTSVVGFVPSAGFAAFQIVAERYAGTVTAHTLTRPAVLNSSFTVRDSAGNTVTDTLPRYFGARFVLHLDTTAVNGTTPVQLRLFRTTESWDPVTANWTMRVDSGSTHLPWAQPGGTVGSLVDTATWTPGSDSVLFHVDSATVAAWNDTTVHERGALVSAVTAGSRLRLASLTYTAQAHSSVRRDTVVEVTPGLAYTTFVYTPPVPATPGILRVGGVPAWRSYLTFAPDLETRTLSCPASEGACTFTLKQATVNFASILLQPAPPGAFPPEDSVRLSAWVADTSSLLPLSRTPLRVQVGVQSPASPPSAFSPAPSTTPVAVPVSLFMAALAGDTTRAGSAAAATRRIALIHYPEPGLFGVGTFYGRTAGALAPKLRLIVTLATEAQLP